ncbi:uncharacterized protein [Dysidea avara]|uniref:uncharacterized protein isoform X2 n=1 Tax=Dysidea avara TaxID=196820 RepID=UPI00331DACCB
MRITTRYTVDHLGYLYCSCFVAVAMDVFLYQDAKRYTDQPIYTTGPTSLQLPNLQLMLQKYEHENRLMQKELSRKNEEAASLSAVITDLQRQLGEVRMQCDIEVQRVKEEWRKQVSSLQTQVTTLLQERRKTSTKPKPLDMVATEQTSTTETAFSPNQHNRKDQESLPLKINLQDSDGHEKVEEPVAKKNKGDTQKSPKKVIRWRNSSGRYTHKNPEECLSRTLASRCFQLGWQQATCSVTGCGKRFSSDRGYGHHALKVHGIQHGLAPLELQVTVIPPSSGVTPMSVYHGMAAF